MAVLTVEQLKSLTPLEQEALIQQSYIDNPPKADKTKEERLAELDEEIALYEQSKNQSS